jgi:disulfide bond formation protein DsbB
VLQGAAVALPLLAVAAALYTQHVLDMMPCPWCVLQRLICVAIAAVALPGLFAARPWLRRGSSAAVTVLALCGVGAALWQHFVAAATAACVQTLADRIVAGLGLVEALPEVFAPYASCADAAVPLLGLPYPFWSLGLFLVLGAIGLRGLLRRD